MIGSNFHPGDFQSWEAPSPVLFLNFVNTWFFAFFNSVWEPFSFLRRTQYIQQYGSFTGNKTCKWKCGGDRVDYLRSNPNCRPVIGEFMRQCSSFNRLKSLYATDHSVPPISFITITGGFTALTSQSLTLEEREGLWSIMLLFIFDLMRWLVTKEANTYRM